MKKIFSFLAAVLFAGSMMAADATMTKGTNGYDDFTVNGKPAVKIGTGSKGGDMSVTVGAGATSLTVYAAAWKGVSGLSLNITAPEGVTITPASINLAAEENFTGSEKAFTVADESAYKFDFVISGADAEATFTFTTSIAKRFLMWGATYEAVEGGEPVEPTPTELQAVSDSTTWDFSKITANTANALYGNDGIQLTDESTPSKNDEVIYADYSADFMTIGEDFNKAAIAFKGEYPIRKNKYCQAGTLHFKADVAGTIVVKFSDTGSSASATAVKRYLVVNGVQTEEWTSRENNGETPYDAQLNVVSGKIAVPAGDVTITGSSAIVVYYITFVPAQEDEPVVVPADTLTCAAAAELALNGNTEEKIIKGYVTEIVEAWSSFKNVSFWMADAADGGQVFEAFRVNCETEAEAPIVGDLVWVKGNLTAYTKNGVTIAETTKGGSFGIIEAVERPVVEPAVNLGAKTIAEFLELKNTKDTCILTGIVANLTNTTYGNYDLVELNNAEVSVAIYGTLTPEGASQQFESLNVAEGDTLTVKAIYREYNGQPQPKNVIFVEVKKAAVEPGETIELAFTDGGVDNRYYANYGSTDIQLYNIPVVGGQLQGDGDFLQLEVYPADPNDISGEYSIEDEGLDDYYTYLMRVNGTDTTEIEFVSGSITVSVQNPDKETSSADLTVQGQLMTAEGNVYVINSTLKVYYNFTISEDEKYKFDEAEAEFNYNFDTYQILPTGSDIAVGVLAQTDEAMIVAMIVLPEGQTELVAGEYAVSVMPMYGTVMAGQYTAEGPQPSYAMTPADQKLWYLVSGKVTVEGDGSIVIDALNSNGKAIKSTLNHLQGEGIDEVNAAVKATKTLKNGQLIIEKAGVRYNAQGAVIR